MLSALREGQKANLYTAPIGVLADDTVHCHLARDGRRVALAHELHDQETADRPDDRIDPSGGRSRTHLIVHIQTRANDGRVPDPTVILVGRPTRGARPREIAGSIEREHTDRVVILNVDGWRDFPTFRLPSLPRRTRLRSE